MGIAILPYMFATDWFAFLMKASKVGCGDSISLQALLLLLTVDWGKCSEDLNWQVVVSGRWLTHRFCDR